MDSIFALLKSLASTPPVECIIQCRISVLSASDMKNYWHIYKLVKCHQEELLQLIEQGEPHHLDMGVRFTISAIPTDRELKSVSFKEADII
jgi:hypothetical protein